MCDADVSVLATQEGKKERKKRILGSLWECRCAGSFTVTSLLLTTRMRSELVGRVSGVVAVQTNKQTPHLSPFFLDLYSQTDKQPVLEKMRFQKITSKEIEIVNGQFPISCANEPF